MLSPPLHKEKEKYLLAQSVNDVIDKFRNVSFREKRVAKLVGKIWKITIRDGVIGLEEQGKWWAIN